MSVNYLLYKMFTECGRSSGLPWMCDFKFEFWNGFRMMRCLNLIFLIELQNNMSQWQTFNQSETLQCESQLTTDPFLYFEPTEIPLREPFGPGQTSDEHCGFYFHICNNILSLCVVHASLNAENHYSAMSPRMFSYNYCYPIPSD